ncbi:MAG TPA: DUF3857 domain-containing protein [bacterium]|nr:DUF3857 domain-containing protein [bacterium]HOL46672.1 DUF3857 domain-containing protein [bacterium]HPQ18360.1 DUF3857 domain-containing protein [bacterium]
MKQKYLFIFIIFLFVFSLNSAIVKFSDNREIETDEIYFNNNEFTIKNATFSKDKINEIIFIKSKKESEEQIADTQVEEIINKAKEAIEKYKDYPAIILIDNGKWQLKEDGSRKYKYHFQGLILKESGKELAEVSLTFNETEENVNILLARTIHFNKNVYYLSSDKIQVVSPQQEIKYFMRNKQKVFQLEHLELPCIIEYIYEYDEFNPFDTNIFSGGWHFQSNYPVVLSEVEIEIPKKSELSYELYNCSEYKPDSKIIEEEESKIYYFALKNVLPYYNEPFMPPKNDIIPSLSFTNQMNWNYIFEWYKKMQLRRMEQKEEIIKVVKEIISDEIEKEKQIAKIYHWLQEKILYISIKGSAGSGLSGHPAIETLENKYGDCIDKAILFSTMLSVIDIKAYPVIVKTNDYSLRPYKLPTLGGNHAITKIELNGKEIFLDATSTSHRYPSFRADDQLAPYVCALKEEIGIVPLPRPEENERKYNYTILIEKDEPLNLNVDFFTEYNGNYEANVRAFWRAQRKIDFPIIMRQWISSIHPDAEIISYDVENLDFLERPLSIKTQYKIKNYIIKAGNIYILKLLGVKKYFPEIALDENVRKYDIVYPAIESKVNEIKIKIPDFYSVDFLPEEIKLENDFIYFERKINYDKENQIIHYKDRFDIKSKIVPVSMYASHKNLLQKIEKLTDEQIILIRK